MNKMIKSLGLLTLLLAGFANSANAALILNITDDGGFARFTFDGEDVFLADGIVNNGVWLASDRFDGLFNLSTYGERTRNALVSGSAALTYNGNLSEFVDTWWNGSESYNTLGIRFTSNVYAVAGKSVSWTGSILSQLSFDHFNTGRFLSSRIGPSEATQATLTEDLIINVGPAVAVPAPAPLALLGLGLALLGLQRRKSY